MNHLKYFESSENLYYTPISEGEYNHRTKDDELKFTKKEIYQIKDLIDKCKRNKSQYNSYIVKLPGNMIRIDSRNIGISTTVFKFIDEWYYISFYIEREMYFYKCDQFEGLIQCIKDHLEI